MARSIILGLYLIALCMGRVSGDLFSDRLDSAGLNGDKYVDSKEYFEEGDDLNITCSLPPTLQQTYTAQDIGFYSSPYKYKGNLSEQRMKCVPDSDVQILDSTSVCLSRKATVQDARTFTCFVPKENCKDKVLQLTEIGTSADIQVEYKVANVTDFHCVVENWVVMNCTWKHPKAYVDPEDIQVTLMYKVSGINNVYGCAQHTFYWCTVERPQMAPYGMGVSVTNRLTNQTTSQGFIVDASKIVKPGPVSGLAVVPADPGCFNISWSHDQEKRTKVFRVKHRALNKVDINVLTNNLTQMWYRACGYPSYSTHSFLVDCLPVGLCSGYWSDATVMTATTVQTAPAVGPGISPGSYVSETCGERNETRVVQFFWKEVPEDARNGPIDAYILKVGPNVVANVSGFSAFVDLPCGKATTVQLFASNGAGESIVPAVWEVLSDNVAVPEILQNSFAVEVVTRSEDEMTFKEMTSRVIWDWLDSDPGGVVNILWCEKSWADKSCKGPISWLEASVTDREVKFSPQILAPRNHLFGISFTAPETKLATPAVWTDCMFVKETEAPQIPAPEDVSAEGCQGCARVSWAPQKCSYDTQARVTAHRLTWCQEPRCSEPESITVPPKIALYKISKLSAKSEYLVTVQTLSFQRKGPKEEVRVVPIAPADTDSSSLLGAIIVVVIIVVLLGLALVVALVRKCRGRGKYLRSKMGNHEFRSQYTTPPTSSAPPSPPTARPQPLEDVVVEDADLPTSGSELGRSGDVYNNDPSDPTEANSRTLLLLESPTGSGRENFPAVHNPCGSAENVRTQNGNKAAPDYQPLERFDMQAFPSATSVSSQVDQAPPSATTTASTQVDSSDPYKRFTYFENGTGSSEDYVSRRANVLLPLPTPNTNVPDTGLAREMVPLPTTTGTVVSSNTITRANMPAPNTVISVVRLESSDEGVAESCVDSEGPLSGECGNVEDNVTVSSPSEEGKPHCGDGEMGGSDVIAPGGDVMMARGGDGQMGRGDIVAPGRGVMMALGGDVVCGHMMVSGGNGLMTGGVVTVPSRSDVVMVHGGNGVIGGGDVPQADAMMVPEDVVVQNGDVVVPNGDVVAPDGDVVVPDEDVALAPVDNVVDENGHMVPGGNVVVPPGRDDMMAPEDPGYVAAPAESPSVPTGYVTVGEN